MFDSFRQCDEEVNRQNFRCILLACLGCVFTDVLRGVTSKIYPAVSLLVFRSGDVLRAEALLANSRAAPLHSTQLRVVSVNAPLLELCNHIIRAIKLTSLFSIFYTIERVTAGSNGILTSLWLSIG